MNHFAPNGSRSLRPSGFPRASRFGHCLGFTLLVVAATPPSPADAAPATPIIVVIDTQSEKLPPPHGSTDLAVQLQEGLVNAGCSVPRICRGTECGGSDLTDATHVLSFTGRYEPKRFACSLSLEARNATARVVEYRASTNNPVCPITQLISDTRDAGRRACEELRRAGERPVAQAATLPPIAGLGTPSAPSSSDESPSVARRLVGPALMAAGAGIGAVGIYQLREKDDPSHCQANGLGNTICTHTKQRPLALPLLLVGAAAFGIGGWDLVQITAFSDGHAMIATARGTF